MPKISIVIPVYNTEDYLEQCLDSVLNQTLTDIEVLCVDDNSKDQSLAILNHYQQQDHRVRVYHFDEPKSALQARKLGVMEALGEYILFLDADDYLEKDACRLLYEKITKEQVDILHFSSRVVNCANLPLSRINSNQKLLTPCQEKITGAAVFDACFRQQKYFITLWNKLMRAPLCKKAFGYMEDRYLPKAQDLYSFFIISHFAESYLGWVTEPLHNYCLGRGVVGSASMNLDKFERYCTQANVADALEVFCKSQNLLKTHKEIINQYRKKWLDECVRIWRDQLPKELAVGGWEILCQYWGSKHTIARAAEFYWLQRPSFARKLENMPKIPLQDRNIKTIAFYYYHFTTGGVQRVIALLMKMFMKMGYRVVLITDTEPTADDFPLPEGAVRTTIFNWSMTKDVNVIDRLDSWEKLLKEYRFDMVFYHAWTSNIMLWDFLHLKNLGIPVVAQTHSVFSFAVNKFQHLFTEVTRILPLVDSLVVLSEADKVFWSAYTPNVYVIPNPISDDLEQAVAAQWENHSLIWVGRVSNEKQPWAIFSIMEKVVQQVPDAKLYLLGNFEDSKWEKLAAENGIASNVIFCGLTQDVNSYYQKAAIHVSTSKYEGFLMTLLEAQAHSLPTVMFHMPYLTMGIPEFGVIGVDQMDCTAAAAEIVKLLKNRDHWQHNSKLAYQGYTWLKQYDFESAWQQVLTGAETSCELTKSTRDMIYTFVNHYEEGLKSQENQQIQLMLSKPGVLNFGRVIIFLPQPLAGFVQCCRDHGFLYTIKYGWYKIKNKLFRKK